MAQPEIGRWSDDLHARYCAARAAGDAAGARRLMSQILVTNSPLVKVLTAQVCGITEDGAPPPPSRRRKSGGFPRIRVRGADAVPWEDLFQAGLLGFQAAVERFDPTKGKLSGYARIRILHAVQTMLRQQDPNFMHVPKAREAERPPVQFHDFSEDKSWIDAVVGGQDPEADRLDDEPWLRCRSLAEARRLKARQDAERALWDRWDRNPEIPIVPVPRVPRVYSVPRPAIVCFIEARCRRAFTGRAVTWQLWDRWRRDRRAAGQPEGSRQEFVVALERQGMARVSSVRWGARKDTKAPGYRGLSLSAP